jgi:hypothetical protein
MKRPKRGKWVKADRVRITKVNGADVIEIQRKVKKKRKPATRKRR